MTDRERAHIVIALTGTTGKKHEGCRVVPHGEPYPAIYSQVYGPASQRDCEKWMASNCSRAAKK
ncbi:MAG TPA: hypothetical protein VER32_12120 [Pyrinomonadaceae bacterium]|nr:hypothetical protein [Pyrinomonadaceae bacterium]